MKPLTTEKPHYYSPEALDEIAAKLPYSDVADVEVVEVGSVERHYGPGAHPGTGTEQVVHAPGDGAHGVGQGREKSYPPGFEEIFGPDRLQTMERYINENAADWAATVSGETKIIPRGGDDPYLGMEDYWILANGDAVSVQSHDATGEKAVYRLRDQGLLDNPKGVSGEALLLALGLVRYSTSGERGVMVGDRKMTDEQFETVSRMAGTDSERIVWETVKPYVLQADGTFVGWSHGKSGYGLPGLMELRHYGPGPHPGTGTEQVAHAGGEGQEKRGRTTGEETNLPERATALLAKEFGVAKKLPSEGWMPPSFIAPDGTILAPGEDHQGAALRVADELGKVLGATSDYDRGNEALDWLIQELGFVRTSWSANEVGFQAKYLEGISEEQLDSIARIVASTRQESEGERYSYSLDLADEATARQWLDEEQLFELLGLTTRHYGPGAHPGTGTSQDAHAGEGEGYREAAPADYIKARDAALAKSPYAKFVSHYTDDELGGMIAVLLSTDGKTGMAVRDRGEGKIEGTGLFSDGDSGDGRTMLLRGIRDHGVNLVEAFDRFLPEQYAKLGFREVERYPFDPDQAPPGWNYARFDSPDYVIMALPRKEG